MKNIGFKTVFLFVLLIISALFTIDSFAKTVTDPNHQGWTGKHPKLKQVEWKPVEVKCKQCSKMADQYNSVVSQLLTSRYWVKFWREVQSNREKGKKDPFWPGEGDISKFEGKAVSANLELMELQSAQLELHRKLIITLEQQASYLRAAIAECEVNACGEKKPTKNKDIKVGGEAIKGGFEPDVKAILKLYGIDWNGPYSTTCLPCKDYVNQLNALPGWVVRAHQEKQIAEQLLRYAEMVEKSNKVSLESLKYNHPDKVDAKAAKARLDKAEKTLASYQDYFRKLLTSLSDCERKFCNASTEPENISLDDPTATALISPALNCPRPAADQPINVGANDDIGSSANFKEKTNKKLVGAATSAITGLLGLGGGGSGGKQEGPPTFKDPIKNKHKTEVESRDPKREIRTGGAFTQDGLLISTDIKDAPGQGTFQTVYMQNPRGWRLMPVALYLYEIWREWKLSVSWTRDTYVDGEHVKHEEGGWSESWRELIAKGEEVIYREVYDGPLWEYLGFNTAVSGARSLGTLFPVSPQMLANEPLNLVIHITDPKKDPVTTVPYLFRVSLGEKNRIVIEPVKKTIAQERSVCEELAALQEDIAARDAAAPENTRTDVIDEDMASPMTNEFTFGTDRSAVREVLAGSNFKYRRPAYNNPVMDSTHTVTTPGSSRPRDFHSVLDDIASGPQESMTLVTDKKRMASVYTPDPDKAVGDALSILLTQPAPSTAKVHLRVDDTAFAPDHHSLSELPEVTKQSPGRDASATGPATSFVLTFSEPMDTATVEDNFIIRSFTSEALSSDLPGDTETLPMDSEDGFFQIWDSRAFDVDWNSDDTEVTFTFTGEPPGTGPSASQDDEFVSSYQEFDEQWKLDESDFSTSFAETVTGKSRAELIKSSDTTFSNPEFEAILNKWETAESYTSNFGVEEKQDILDQLTDFATQPGMSERATEINEFADSLQRQIDNAQSFADSIKQDGDRLFENLSDDDKATFESYVKQRKKREEIKQASGYLIQPVDQVGSTVGSGVFSVEDARKFLDRFINPIKLHSVLSDIDTGELAMDEDGLLYHRQTNDAEVSMLLDQQIREAVTSIELVAESASNAAAKAIRLTMKDALANEMLSEPGTLLVKTDRTLAAADNKKLKTSRYWDANAFNLTWLDEDRLLAQLTALAEPASSDIAQRAFSDTESGKEDNFADRDGDGIEDSIDTLPDEYSDEFVTEDGTLPGRIINRNGNSIRVSPLGYSVIDIEVGAESSNPSVVELIGVELELDPGTILDADFG